MKTKGELSFALVDDDKSDRERLKGYVIDYCDGKGIEYKISEYNDGMDFISKYKSNFDIILMDIEMNLLDGLKTAKKLREIDEDTVLIFVTRMAQYSLKGYDVDALCYMVKPVSYEDFRMSIIKAERQLSVRSESRIIVSFGAMKRVISTKHIYYIECLKHELTIHTTSGDIKCYGTLKEYAERLNAIISSCVINLFSLICSMYPNSVKTK